MLCALCRPGRSWNAGLQHDLLKADKSSGFLPQEAVLFSPCDYALYAIPHPSLVLCPP